MLRFNYDNDFKFTIQPKLNGELIDLTELEELKLTVSNQYRSSSFTPIWRITDVGLDIEVQKEMVKWTGVYTVFLTYRRPDGTYSDFFQDKKIGCPTFEIVPVGCKTDNDGEDVVIGVSPEYKGDKGDKGDSAYEVWLKDNPGKTKEDYFAYLRQPAVDAGASISELERVIQSNETNRVDAEALRVQAEIEREETIREAQTATQEAATAASLANTARLAIQDDLELKANHGYASNPKTLKQVDDDKASHGYESNPKTLKEVDNEKAAHGYGAEPQKTLKQVDDEVIQLKSDVEQLAYVKIKNEAVNGNFENGLIGSFRRSDGFGGESTLAINSSTPISGNYDIRLTITTPATERRRPLIRGLDRAANIGDKIYIHFYAKILSGTPTIALVQNGIIADTIYGGDVINGRNTKIIDVEGTSDGLGIIYFDSVSVWDMQIDNFMRINLTEAFGAGNEPTEEEMNLLLDMLPVDYFEGEIAIPAQKVMQWQLKLIRKNKNAIIALGGTII